MTHEEENRLLLEKYIDVHYLQEWSNLDTTPATGLELMVSSACNTKCSYCYIKNFGKDLFPISVLQPSTIIANEKLLLDYLWENKLFPKNLDIFTGELFNLPYYNDVISLAVSFIEKCNKYIKENNHKRNILHICVPTNATWLDNEQKRLEVEDWIVKSRCACAPIVLSLSVDGLFSDSTTRQKRDGSPYSEAYYDKLFTFAEKYGFHFHPMVSADNIGFWKENFLWYISEIKKHSSKELSDVEAARRIYLLEVRNPDWSTKELEQLIDFIKFLVEWCLQAVGGDRDKFLQEFALGRTLNFLGMGKTINRGMTCSIQTSLFVRLGDLALPLCHRTSYEKFLGGRLLIQDKHMSIVPVNPLTYTLVDSFDAKTGPVCRDCPISCICNLYCIGCNYEINKDFFTPVETVCDLEKIKIGSIFKAFAELSIDETLLNHLNEQCYGRNFAYSRSIKDRPNYYYYSMVAQIRELFKSIGDFYGKHD